MVVVVNSGRIRVSVVSAESTESAALLPSARKRTMRCLIPPASRQIPTTPLQMIITVAKTVSRARLTGAFGYSFSNWSRMEGLSR